MRYTFVPLSAADYSRAFRVDPITRGGGIEDITVYRPSQYYRGGGIWSFMRGVGRRVLPFLKRFVLPGLFNVGSKVVDDVANDRGSVKDSIQRHGMDGVREVIGKATRGGGSKKKKRCGSKIRGTAAAKRRRTGVGKYIDVFSLL